MGYHFGVEVGTKTSKLLGPQPSANNMATEEEAQEDQEAWEKVCPGSANAPTAAAGYLCVYIGEEENAPNTPYAQSLDEAAHEFGVVLPYSGVVGGSWAVTAN